MPGNVSYFVTDIHLGVKVGNPAERERLFVSFLRSIASDAGDLYLLGDIWDFWYEYKYVVPKGYVQVFAAIQDLIAAGVRVWFFTGNHDVWAYHYFEDMGMRVVREPLFTEIEGRRFCLAHGDGLGPVPFGYRVLRGIFHCRFLQVLFSTVHPRIALALGYAWSNHNRLAHRDKYVFRGVDEPLYKWADAHSDKADIFIFGHFHANVDLPLSGGARLIVIDSWIDGSPYLRYSSGILTLGGYSQNRE